MTASRWIADRMQAIESSGIRKVFELARTIRDPINLSIGQPDFDVPDEVKDAACAAISRGHNSYTLTQGIPDLRDKLLADVRQQLDQPQREMIITSGTSGGLLLALMATINPGDEVIIFDPYFVMYPQLVRLLGGVPVFVDTYPDFAIDLDRVKAAIGPRTKIILFNSPANPTGRAATPEEANGLATLAAKHGVLLISDEIYRLFSYDREPVCPARGNPDVLVIDGFSKSHAMTGWRLGYVHGPAALIQEMIRLQQFTFVCAPSMAQHAGIRAWGVNMSAHVANYRHKRDLVVAGLKDCYELTIPGGAFYLFPRAPRPSAMAFVEEAIRRSLLIIPGNVFSQRDTHFRLSFAADDRTLERGIAVLRGLAS